jgi:hypothetical protein
MHNDLTLVEIAFFPDYVNHWLRFGIPDLDYDLDRRRAIACFKPNRIFGYVRWIANDYGTQVWRFDVLKTVGECQPLTRIEGVHPGGEILLKASGKTKVTQALSLIDSLEESGFDPTEVSECYFRQVHNRIAVRQPLHSYSEAQHMAVSAARRVAR